MFEPNQYRELCSELHFSEEKLQEVIQMTEKQKSKRIRPVRVGLVAAALAAVLVVSVSAANVQAIQDFFISFTTTSTVVGTDANGASADIPLPEVGLETKDGRSLLTVDGEETDITDALQQEGRYTAHKIREDGSSYTLEVRADGSADITSYDADGKEQFAIGFDANTQEDGGPAYYASIDDAGELEGTAIVVGADADGGQTAVTKTEDAVDAGAAE